MDGVEWAELVTETDNRIRVEKRGGVKRTDLFVHLRRYRRTVLYSSTFLDCRYRPDGRRGS